MLDLDRSVDVLLVVEVFVIEEEVGLVLEDVEDVEGVVFVSVDAVADMIAAV